MDATNVPVLEAPPKENIDETPKFVDRDNLSPIENAFYGSTTWINGEPIMFDDIFRLLQATREGDKQAQQRLCDPVFIQLHNSSVDDVREDRSIITHERVMRGVLLSVFDTELLLDLYEKGLQVCIEPAKLDNEGHAIPKWRVVILNRALQEVNDPKAFRMVVIRDMFGFSDHLELQDSLNNKSEKMLTLKPLVKPEPSL